jgi:hypothetical protein
MDTRLTIETSSQISGFPSEFRPAIMISGRQKNPPTRRVSLGKAE